MKKAFLFIVMAAALWSCKKNNLLDIDPLTRLSESPEFWENANNLQTFSNSFYNYVNEGVITGDFSSDNAEHIGNPPPIRLGVYAMPTALGSAGWSWSQLRNINYFIEHAGNSGVAAGTKNMYLGVAKFFRAYFYFDKVKQFGDVPWYSKALKTNDEAELYKPRDSRTLIVDSILKDLDFAIQYLEPVKYKNRISKWTALALKSRICLYEGTWRKYHTEASLPGATDLLTKAATASKELIDAKVYSLYSTGHPESDYFNLFLAADTYKEEVILAKSSDNSTFYYTPLFTSTSNGNYGATRSLVSTYLMKDGRTFQQQYPDEEQRDTMSYFMEFQDRDPRLRQSIVYPGYVRVGTTNKSVSDFSANRTGYMIMKRVGPPIEDQGGDYRDRIIIRYAEVLLNYAEARAELGLLSQADLNLSINVIRNRAGIAPLTLPVAVDPTLDEMYVNTSDPLILEVRRERNVELAFEGFRTDDLKRWKEGHLFRSVYEGIYITGLHKYIDLDQDGSPNLYVLRVNETPPSPQVAGVQYFRLSAVNGLSEGDKGRLIPYNKPLPAFKDWEYLNPIPNEELTLNTELEQNPGWK